MAGRKLTPVPSPHRRPLDWGPEARESLPHRRYSQDDITVGYGGERINHKRFSVPEGPPAPWAAKTAASRRTLAPETLLVADRLSPYFGGSESGSRSRQEMISLLQSPRRKRSSVVDAAFIYDGIELRKSSFASARSTFTPPQPSGENVSKTPDIEEIRRQRIVLVVVAIGFVILLISVLLVTITLHLSPRIDEMVRKENEEMLKQFTQTSGTANGVQDNSSTSPNLTLTSSTHNPGTTEG